MKKQYKKEFVCEQDRIMAAFAKVNLREAVDPIVRGKIVEDEETYNKVQQLLDCPDMEHAHQFLLDVDFEDLTPEVKQKIDDLYQLAVSQGYLDVSEPSSNDSIEDDSADVEVDEQMPVSDNSGGFENDVPNPEDAAVKNSIGMNAPTLNSSAFTLFYSAMKNGEIKSGECYSNATTLENAKLDAIQKLQKLGFTAVDIIAAEETDLNAKGCDSFQPEEFGAPLNDTPAEAEPQPVNDVEATDFTEDADSVDDDSEDSEDSDEDCDDTVKEAEEADNKDAESEDDEESKKEEPEEEDSDNDEELSRSEKLDMFKRYLEEFKGLLQKMKAETYADMSLADRAKFYDEMSKIWSGKPDPAKFMSDDNVKQIEHMKIKIVK